MGHIHAHSPAGCGERDQKRHSFQFCRYGNQLCETLAGKNGPGLWRVAGRKADKAGQHRRPLPEKEFSQVYNVSPLISRWGRNFYYQNEYAPGVLQGVLPGYSNIESVEIRPGNGRFINQADIRLARKVIVLHSRTAGLLFKDKDPWENILPMTMFHIR